jgi:glycosyltransferase involved in cell wall biosynthesis
MVIFKNKIFYNIKILLKKNITLYKIFVIFFNFITKLYLFYNFKKFLKILPNIEQKKLIIKEKKLLFTISRIANGGAEKQFVKLAELIKKKKIKSLFLAFDLKLNNNKNYYEYLQKKDFKNIKFIKIRNVYKELKNICKKKEIKGILKTHNLNFFDDVEKLMFLHTYIITLNYKPSIIHSYLDTPNIFAGIIGAITNVKKVVISLRSISPNNFEWCRFFYLEIYKLLLNYKKIIFVTNSKNGALSYSEWLNCKKNKIKLINNIYNFRKKINNNSRKKINNNIKKIITFGTISRLDKNKNTIYSIRLIETLVKKYKLNIKFFIIGDGLLKNSLVEYVLKNNLNNNIKFLGEKSNLSSYFSNIDVFIFSTKIEGTPNVLLEAQNYQLPIFSTNVGGISDAVIKNYTTYFLNGNNLDNDASIIYRKLNSNNFLKKRSFLYIKKKLKKFSDNEVYKSLNKIYNA